MNQSKKIGIVCTSPGFGGLEMFTLQLAKALQEKGWTITMLLNERSKLNQEAKKIFPVKTIQDFGKNKNTSSVIRKWNKEANNELLFTPYNKDIKALAVYKRFTSRKIKLVYQQHMKVGVKKRDFIHRMRYNMLDLWITPLEYLRQETLEKTTVKDDKIRIVSVGLDFEKFENTTITTSLARSVLQLPQDGFIVGVLGRIDPKKGQDFLIKAMASLKEENKNIHLLIMGDITAHEGSEWLQHLYSLVEKNDLKDRVHFKPYQENVLLFYRTIDVFAMPSHGETYGLVTLEAMYCEKPVIGVNKEGTKALLEDGKLGWLHELEDVEEFKQRLFSIINNEKKITEIIAAAKETVMEKYNIMQTMDEMDKVLSELVSP